MPDPAPTMMQDVILVDWPTCSLAHRQASFGVSPQMFLGVFVECPLLARNGSSGRSIRLPLFPQLQTFLWSSLTSACDPKRTLVAHRSSAISGGESVKKNPQVRGLATLPYPPVPPAVGRSRFSSGRRLCARAQRCQLPCRRVPACRRHHVSGGRGPHCWMISTGWPRRLHP